MKCWIEFDFKKKCCSVLPLFQQSCILKRVTWAILANHESLSYFRPGLLASFATKMADEEDLMVVDEQPESQKGKKRDEEEASLEGFENRHFEQMSGSIAFKIL